MRISTRELESRSLTNSDIFAYSARYGIRTHAARATTTSTWPINLFGNLACVIWESNPGECYHCDMLTPWAIYILNSTIKETQNLDMLKLGN